jgi:hypothetical protein
MDLTLDDTERDVVDAARRIFADAANTLKSLSQHGYLDLSAEGAPLLAELVVEQAARAAIREPVAARMLVAPALLSDLGPASVALMSAGQPLAPVRFGAQADVVLVLDGDEVVVVEPKSGQVEELDTSFGYPVARVHAAGGRRLAAGTGPVMLAWWRVALAAEAVGCMESAIEVTVRYTREREMFGTKLASFQAVRHRLAESHAHTQAAKWLVRDAAASHAEPAKAASAWAYTADVAKAVIDDCHQFHGALGLTTEHSLHRWTLRLQALRIELGGVRRHERELAALAWPAREK